MDMIEWEKLNGGEYLETYSRWMRNEENRMRCENCPANQEFEPGGDWKLPCGQYHCWVDVHCRPEDF